MSSATAFGFGEGSPCLHPYFFLSLFRRFCNVRRRNRRCVRDLSSARFSTKPSTRWLSRFVGMSRIKSSTVWMRSFNNSITTMMAIVFHPRKTGQSAQGEGACSWRIAELTVRAGLILLGKGRIILRARHHRQILWLCPGVDTPAGVSRARIMTVLHIWKTFEVGETWILSKLVRLEIVEVDAYPDVNAVQRRRSARIHRDLVWGVSRGAFYKRCLGFRVNAHGPSFASCIGSSRELRSKIAR